jgi:hypothetical protein
MCLLLTVDSVNYFLPFGLLAGATTPRLFPDFFEYRSLDPSAEIRTPNRVGLSVFGQTNITLRISLRTLYVLENPIDSLDNHPVVLSVDR